MPPMRIRERGKAKKGTMKRLVKTLFKLYPWQIITCAFCVMFNAAANLCSSIFAGLVTGTLTKAIEMNANPFNINGHYTAAVMGGSFTMSTNVTVLLITLGVIYGVGILASWYWNTMMAIVTQRFLNKFRIAMFSHMQDLPIKYFDTHPHGAIMSVYTNDIDTIRQFISQSLPELLRTASSVIFCFVMMMISSIWLTIIVILCAFMMVMNTKVIGGLASKYFIKQQMQLAVVEGDIEESIKGLKVIKVFTHEEKSNEQFKAKNQLFREYSTSANIHGNVTMPINGNIGNFMYVLVAVFGCLMIILPGFKNFNITGFHDISSNTESMSVFNGLLVMFLMMVRMFTNNVSQFSQQITFIVMGMAGASRCFDMMDEKPEIDNGYVMLVNCKYDENGNIIETEEKTRQYAWKHQHGDGRLEYKPLKGDIVLEHVDFSYVPGRQILKDVSVYARPGQKIALVGATGAGKTTIISNLAVFNRIETVD